MLYKLVLVVIKYTYKIITIHFGTLQAIFKWVSNCRKSVLCILRACFINIVKCISLFRFHVHPVVLLEELLVAGYDPIV